MNEVARLHDEYVLAFIQQYFFAYPLLSGLIVTVLLVAPPVHRRSGRMVIGLTAAFAMVTVAVYRVHVEAPLLGCVLILVALYGVLRSISWTHLGAQKNTGRIPHLASFRPRAEWMDGFIREYFRVDPRGVYWLDLARASRGRVPERSSQERLLARLSPFELPAWRTQLWWNFVFPLVEFRIALWPKLPRYWHLDHKDLDLGESPVQTVLRQEIAAAARLADEYEAGSSFEDYRRRAVDTKMNDQALHLASHHSHRYCRLTEAWLESKVFGEVYESGDKRLCEVADHLVELWRYRRRHQQLWASQDVSEDERDLITQSSSQESDVSQAPSDPLADQIEAKPSTHGEDAFESQDEELTASEIGTQPSIETIQLQLESDHEKSLESHDVDAEESQPASELPSEIIANPPSAELTLSDTESNGRSDAPLRHAPDAVGPEHRESLDDARLRDLLLACRLLEAYLNFNPDQDLTATAQAARRLLDRPANWPAVTRLMMLYCLRTDFIGDRHERAKSEIVTWMLQWVRGLLGQNDLVKSVRSIFFDLLIDWHTVRGSYSQIRELFVQNEPRGSRQWELLGLAEANIASQVTDRPKLRDFLIREATASLFRARVHGFWTQRYAGLLLGTKSSSETIRLLRDNVVTFGRSDLDRMFDQTRAQEPQASEVMGEVIEFEPTTTDPYRKSVYNSEKKDSTGSERRTNATVKSQPQSKVPPKPDWFRNSGNKTASKPAEQGPESFQSKSVLETPVPTTDGAQTPALVLVDCQSGRRIPCTRFPVKFGSDQKYNQVCHPRLEKRHCAISCENGLFSIVALTERQGISVNDMPVDQLSRLRHGDIVQIGPFQFEVESL